MRELLASQGEPPPALAYTTASMHALIKLLELVGTDLEGFGN
jgi:hypothetical protein